MRTKEAYFHKICRMKSNLYHRGALIGRDADVLESARSVVGMTFDACADPELSGLCTATSHINGLPISRFNHVHQNVDDLHKKQDMTRALANRVSICFQRCVGVDALNALSVISYEADRINDHRTSYYQNFISWLDGFQRQDLVACCAQTDAKGHRKKRPSEQENPDAYLRVVEKGPDGIVVRGCKFHVSGGPTADEIIIIPGRALGPGEKEYAVAFAVPADHDGVKHVVNCHTIPARTIYGRKNSLLGYSDSYIIFDDAFIPWHRVFLCGETHMGGMCALLFSVFRRHSSTGCKPGLADIYLGLAANAAEISGIADEKHVKKILTEFIKISELAYAAGYTASALGKPEAFVPGLGYQPMGPGTCIPDAIYANIGRSISGEGVFHEKEMLCNIAGAIPATIPDEATLTHEDIREDIERYIMRSSVHSSTDQIRFWQFFSDMATQSISGVMAYGYYHGGGSPIMEEIALLKQYDIDARKENVRRHACMGKAGEWKKLTEPALAPETA